MTMLAGKLIKNPGARVPGRISHPPLDSYPLWLSVSSLAKSWTTDYNSSLESKPIEGEETYYSKAWMRDQIERKICLCWFSVRQTDTMKEEAPGPAGFA